MYASILKATAVAGAALFFSLPVFADNPGKHPAYLHALSDLRDARAHLDKMTGAGVDVEAQHAVQHIDEAIGDIKKAAIMDGKNIDDHVAVDSHMESTGRFHRAMELLDKAKADVSGEEDQSDTAGLQQRGLKQIDPA